MARAFQIRLGNGDEYRFTEYYHCGYKRMCGSVFKAYPRGAHSVYLQPIKSARVYNKMITAVKQDLATIQAHVMRLTAQVNDSDLPNSQKKDLKRVVKSIAWNQGASQFEPLVNFTRRLRDRDILWIYDARNGNA